ncbi:MAG TPA: GAF domain-containing protein, partial [Anaerolineales bacterium]|nr:GAF domain-containing protein [Anaerolineales bacterium]
MAKKLVYMVFAQEQDPDKFPRGWKTFEKQFRALIAHGQESLSLLDENGVVLFTSPATERLLGYLPEEFVGHNAFEFVHPGDIDACVRLFEQLIAQPSSSIQALFRLHHKDGTWLWFEAIGTNYLHDEDIRALVIHFHDVSEQVAAHDALQRRIAYDQVLLRLSRKIELAQDYSEALQAAQEAISAHLIYQNVWVYWHGEGDELSLLTSVGYLSEMLGTSYQTLHMSGDQFLEELWQSKEAHVIEDAQTDPRTDKKITSHLGNRTIINVPMILQGRRLGFMGTGTFGAEGVHPPTPEQLDFISAVASHLAVAISRIQLLEELEQRVRFSVLLNSMAHIALAATDLKTMLQQMVDRLAELFRADACYLTLWDEVRHLPIPTIAYGPQRDTYAQLRPEPGELTLTESVLQSEHALLIQDIQNSPFMSPSVAAKIPNPCVLVLSLIAGNQKLGAVIVAYDEVRNFSMAQIIQAEHAVAQIALAIAKTQLIDAERKRREEAETLREAASLLTASFDLHQILNTLLAFLHRVVPYDSACVFLREEDDLQAMALLGHPNRDEILGKCFSLASDQLMPEIMQTQQVMILEDALSDPRFSRWGETNYVRGWMGVPLWTHGTMIGVLTVDSKKVGAYTPVEAHLAQAFADQAALAIDNARLLEAERRRRIEAETLQQLTMTFTGTLELERVLELILSHLQQVIPYDSAHISMIENDRLRVVAQSGFREEGQTLITLKTQELFHIQAIVQHRQPFIIADTRTDPHWRMFPEVEYIQCWMGVPLVVKDQVIGILHLDKITSYFYKAEHASLAMTFANQAAIAIDNARLLEAERRRRTEVETLHEAVSTLAASLELEQVLSNLLASLQRVVPYDSASVFLREGDYVHAVAAAGLPEPELVLNKRFSLEKNLLQPIIYRTGQPLILEDAQTTPGFLKWGNTSYVRGWMGIPLWVRGRIIGVLTIDSRQPGAYTWAEAYLAQSFANQAAIAIENARLFSETLRRQSELASLLTISQTVSSSLDLRQVLEQVSLSMASLLNLKWSSISIYDAKTNMLRSAVEFTAPNEFTTDYGQRLYHLGDYPFTAQILNQNEPCVVRINDPNADPSEVEILKELEVACALLLPLVAAGRNVGLAELYTEDETREFSQEDIRLAQALADQAAIAIANAQLFSETRQRLLEMEAVNRISKGLRTVQGLEDMFPTLMDETLSILSCEAGVIWLFNPMTQQLQPKAARGWLIAISEKEISPDKGIAGKVFQSGEYYQTEEFITDPFTWDAIRPLMPPGWGGVAMPLRVGQESIGAFFVSTQAPRTLTEQEVHLLETISEI